MKWLVKGYLLAVKLLRLASASLCDKRRTTSGSALWMTVRTTLAVIE